MMHYEEGGKPIPDSMEAAQSALRARVKVHHDHMLAEHISSRTVITHAEVPVYLPGDGIEPRRAIGQATFEDGPAGTMVNIKLKDSSDSKRLQSLMNNQILDVSFAYSLLTAGQGGVINKEEPRDG